MIVKIKVKKNQKYGASVYLPKKYIGKYAIIEIISDKEGKKFENLKKEYEKSISKREKELKLHLNKLKELRGL